MTRGRKTGGRPKGAKNKKTIEREAKARHAAEQTRIIQEVMAKGVAEETIQAVMKAPKLMKDIAFDFAHLFTAMAAFYQPYPNWYQEVDKKSGKTVTKNGNPNFNEAKFKEYAMLATQTALGAASYQSPKLSAVMVGSAVVTEIEVTGGLPDEEDGGMIDATANAAAIAGGSGADVRESSSQSSDIPSGPGEAVPAAGEAQSGAVRKALG